MSALNSDEDTPACLASTTPIFVLPDELLSHIFLLVLKASTVRENSGIPFLPYHYPRLGPNFPSLVLSRVCQWWEAIANTTPSLWTAFTCPAHDLDGKTNKILTKFLKNSANAPLHPTIYVQPREPTTLDRLVEVSHRWQSAEIHVNVELSASELASLFTLTEHSLPLLECFTLRLIPQRSTKPFGKEQLHRWFNAFHSASRLRSLYIDPGSSDEGVEWSAFPFPWDQLTHLTAVCPCPAMSTISHILALCPNLETCRIEANLPLRTSDFTTPIMLPSLRYLELTGTGPFESVLRWLRAPALRVLEAHQSLTARAGTKQWSIQPFFDSAQALTELCLYTRLMHPRALVSGLSCTPSLARLTLAADEDASVVPIIELLRALAGEGTATTPLLPNLRVLAVRMSCVYLNDEFVELIGRRWRARSVGLARLEHVQFEYLSGPPMKPDVLARVKALREEGLKLVAKPTLHGWIIGLPLNMAEQY